MNADLIARGLSPFAPERAAPQAGRIALERIRTLAHRGGDFAFETTLSGRTYAPVLRDMSSRGYTVHICYVWIASLDLALRRIALRVRAGGHDIPEQTARRRFAKSARNLFQLYVPLADSWLIFDNSGERPRLIAYERSGIRKVLDPGQFERLLRLAEES